MDEKEELQSAILTINQKEYIQNEIAKDAEAKLELKFDPDKVNHFTQQEAFLSGKIAAYKWLIESSDTSAEMLAQPITNPDNSPDEF